VHPDPHAEQLAKLKQLKNCFMIYDYTSFPQIFHERDDRHDLNLVLNYMNNLVSNVVILGSPDYLQRGWCIYEYLASSFTGSLVCDEVQDPTFVELRDWVHTYAPIPPTRFLFRDSKESMQQNYINDAILTAVNRILPLFKDAAFSVQHDRSSVSQLLRLVLKERLPSKKEHQPYLNEWKTVEWTEQELDDAFERTLTWDAGERGRIARFKMRVPDSIETAARRRFRLDLPKSPLQLWSEGGWRA
jgi:hypothetical protein